METLCLIPVYNEDSTIEFLIHEIHKYEVDILVVDDCSTDKTLEKVKKWDIKIISNSKRLGKGGCIIKGLKFARKNNYKTLIILDGDLEHNPNLIPLFIRKISRYDIVLGQRCEFRSIQRFILNRFGAFFFKLLNQNIYDISCGFKILKISSFKQIQFYSKGFEIDLEILLESLKNELSIGLINIPSRKIEKSHLKISDMISSNNYFDKWIISNINHFKIKTHKKILLLVFSYIGLFIGTMLALVVKWKTFLE